MSSPLNSSLFTTFLLKFADILIDLPYLPWWFKDINGRCDLSGNVYDTDHFFISLLLDPSYYCLIILIVDILPTYLYDFVGLPLLGDLIGDNLFLNRFSYSNILFALI